MRNHRARLLPILILVLLALPLFSGCASKPRLAVETKTVEVPVPVYVPLPEDLTDDCEIPPVPDPYTVGSAIDDRAALVNSLEECNGDKEQIRSIEGRARSETDAG